VELGSAMPNSPNMLAVPTHRHLLAGRLTGPLGSAGPCIHVPKLKLGLTHGWSPSTRRRPGIGVSDVSTHGLFAGRGRPVLPAGKLHRLSLARTILMSTASVWRPIDARYFDLPSFIQPLSTNCVALHLRQLFHR